MNRIVNYIRHPRAFTRGVLNYLAPLIKDDETFIKLKWRLRMDYPLNLENPQTFSEKLQWLKLHDRRPEYIRMVDKVEAKKYVAEIIGEQYVIPTLGVWDNPDEIDFDSLPDQFVLKCNHNSGGGMFICKDKSQMNRSKVVKDLRKALRQNYYWSNREWPYKNVEPMVLAEKYREDAETQELRDYKFFCFDGEPKALFIATDRNNEREETKFDFFDMDFRHLPFTNGHPNSDKKIEKPVNFEEMKSIASMLSKGIPHVRVDLYSVNGRTYFGEMTFTHWSGLMPFEPQEWDYTFGQWLVLPQ